MRLTERIKRLREHLRTNRKDTHNRRNMTIMTMKRRALLLYLRRTEFAVYQRVMLDIGMPEEELYNVGVRALSTLASACCSCICDCLLHTETASDVLPEDALFERAANELMLRDVAPRTCGSACRACVFSFLRLASAANIFIRQLSVGSCALQKNASRVGT